jgi:hypothetical protein
MTISETFKVAKKLRNKYKKGDRVKLVREWQIY